MIRQEIEQRRLWLSHYKQLIRKVQDEQLHCRSDKVANYVAMKADLKGKVTFTKREIARLQSRH